jgi:hypothetical protein
VTEREPGLFATDTWPHSSADTAVWGGPRDDLRCDWTVRWVVSLGTAPEGREVWTYGVAAFGLLLLAQIEHGTPDTAIQWEHLNSSVARLLSGAEDADIPDDRALEVTWNCGIGSGWEWLQRYPGVQYAKGMMIGGGYEPDPTGRVLESALGGLRTVPRGDASDVSGRG